MSFLGPEWLTNQIGIISLLLGAVFLVVFSKAVLNAAVFPLTDFVKKKTGQKARKMGTSQTFSKILSEGFATIVFLVYCYLGSWVLAEYVFGPILGRLRAYLLIVVIILFLVIGYVINSSYFRKKFF